MSPNPHCLVHGSLGKSNIGDELLLRTFLDRQSRHYDALTVLTEQPENHREGKLWSIETPQQALGRRFWRGALDRRLKARLVRDRGPTAPRDFVMLGGLLEGVVPHERFQLKTLAWARPLCRRVVYYFGDVGDKFPECPLAPDVVRALDDMGAWIGLRSTEGLEILDALGMKSPLRAGMDIVLYELATRWGVPFARRGEPSGVLAINPAITGSEELRPIWLAAGRAALRRGLRVRWVSFCDDQDLALCHELQATLAAEAPDGAQEVRSASVDDQALADADACVAARYHGYIVAMAHGLPTIGTPYGSKGRRLVSLLGLDDWKLDATTHPQSDPARLEGRLAELLEAAASGHFAPDYDRLQASMKAHREALDELDGLTRSSAPSDLAQAAG